MVKIKEVKMMLLKVEIDGAKEGHMASGRKSTIMNKDLTYRTQS